MEARPPALLRTFLALMVPLVTFLLQWSFWSFIQPYAWLLFLPAVFISSWIGGLTPGLLATILSATIVTWFFVPPQFTLLGKSPMALISVIIFIAMGTLFSIFHWRLARTKQQAAEAGAKLKESEENLSVTLNSIGDAVIATDAEGRVTRLNAMAEQLTGWSNAEASGKPVDNIFRIINHATREPAIIPVAATLEHGTIHGLANDTVLIAHSGAETPIADSCAPIRSREGQVIGAVLVFRDVSQEYAAQQALQESATRMRTILDTMADGIISINEKGFVEMVNPAAERIFGYAAEELIGRNVSMLMPEPYRSSHDSHLERYMSTGQAHILGIAREFEGLRKDGGRFPLELTVSEMLLGSTRHFVGLTRDMTARRQAENLFNRFFSLSLDMLCISSADGYFKRVNPAFTETLGWSTDELLSRPFLDLVHPDDHAATLREVAEQTEAGKITLKFENRYRHKNGSWRMLSWTSIADDTGLMYATARDITDHRQMTQSLIAAKEQAELANHAKDSFLATMSHEIRTPLSGMLGMLELLSLTSLDEEQRNTLDAAWDSARGLLRIVSDILDWSKIEEGKLELAPRPTSIEQLLKDVINAYSRVASAKSLMLWQHTDPRLGSAYIADPLRLSQVLNNFVSNAIRFTTVGEIEVRAELLEHLDSGDRIRFSVRDTGTGIDKAVQEQLFQRYRQGSADTARMYGGTGLGLSICKRLTDLMDGQISLDSTPGLGSVFSIVLTLPISGLPGEAIKNMYPEARQRDVQPLFTNSLDSPLILAVDDHPINRDLLTRQLQLLGLRSETAENGKVALAMWQKGNYALIITDCHMPEMDGYAFVRELRRMEASASLPHIPVVAWTANALAEEAQRCKDAGMDDLLVNPADMTQLGHVLEKWLDLPGAAGKDGLATMFDRNVLNTLITDESAQFGLLNDFIRHIQADHGKLADAFVAGRLPDIERIAHKMKGASRMVGARELAEACEAIESAAKVGSLTDAVSASAVLKEAISRVTATVTAATK